MREGHSSIDVVTRTDEGVSTTLTAVRLDPDGLVLHGYLADTEVGLPVETTMRASFSPELISGAHVERDTSLTVFTPDGWESRLVWSVQTLDLGDGYQLHDARVSSEMGPIRSFIIEDLAATVGVAGGIALAGIVIWLRERRAGRLLEEIRRQAQACRESGGLPQVVYRCNDEARVDPGGGLAINLGIDYRVDCLPPVPVQESPPQAR